jgi:hypothetical protein
MILTITTDDVIRHAVDHGTVWTLTGTDEDGHRVTFGADHRPAREIIALAADLGEIDVSVEDWQIVSQTD